MLSRFSSFSRCILCFWTDIEVIDGIFSKSFRGGTQADLQKQEAFVAMFENTGGVLAFVDTLLDLSLALGKEVVTANLAAAAPVPQTPSAGGGLANVSIQADSAQQQANPPANAADVDEVCIACEGRFVCLSWC